MLLRSLNKQQVRALQSKALSNKGVEITDLLRKESSKIYFSIDEVNNSIQYECILPDDTCLGFIIKLNRDIVDLFIQYHHLNGGSLSAVTSAFAYYLYQLEMSSDEATLRRRYGHFYDLLNRLAAMNETQVHNYLEQKKELMNLIRLFAAEKDANPSREAAPLLQAELLVELSYDSAFYEPYFKLEFEVTAGSKTKSVPLLALEQLAYDDSSITMSTSAKKATSSVNYDSFSEQDKKIISMISKLIQESNNYVKKATKAITFYRGDEPIISLLNACRGKRIFMNGKPYLVDEEDQPIKIFIDENGAIDSSLDLAPDDIAIDGKDMSLLFQYATKQVHFLRFASKKTKALYSFIVDHPGFDYSLFKEEIGGMLLPKIGSDVVVDNNFEEETKAYRSAIKYYLTYEEDESLTMQTVFSLRGEEVHKEDFLSSLNQEIYSDFAAEIEKLGLLEEGQYKEPDDIVPVLEQDFSRLSRLCSLYLSENLAEKKIRKSIPIRVNTESGIDWFSLSYESDSLSDAEINAVLNAYRKKKKYIRIGKDYYALDNDELAMLATKFTPNETLQTEKLPIYQALRLSHDGKSIVTLSKQIISLFRELNEYASIPLDLDEKFTSILRSYQLDGVKWLYSLASHNLAGILADDMGLGKSLELISFLSLLKETDPVLIVAPKSLLFNWQSEFYKWDKDREVFVFSGSKGERKKLFEEGKTHSRPIFIVSYDTIRIDQSLFEEIHYSALILDEGQYIANAFAQKSKAVKALKSNHRFVLTGTPIQNSFMDLWSLFDFLLPGYLESYKEFQNIYRGYESVHSEEGKKLERLVAPFILRRKKDDVLQDLPAKSEEITRIQFTPEEEKIYSSYLGNVKKQLASEETDKSKIAILAMLTRLRQLCVDPSTFLEFNNISTKLDYVLSMVEQAIQGGHKVLIFSTFAEVLLHFSKLLNEHEIAHHLIYGQTSASKRLSYAEDFNTNPNVSVMLVSLKAGGTGLNLIGADIVVHLDPWWNVAAEEQGTDRAHRIGQTRPVSVYKLIMVGSVEEKVIELQEKKKELTAILHSEGEFASSLTEEDLYYLLS